MEAFTEARQAGKIRYIGFTGHKDPQVHLYMLEKAKEHEFRFDTVQMPLNVMDAHFRSFEANVLPVLVKEGIGVLSMKSMGSGVFLKSKTATPIECLHYALSLPASVVITGIDSMEILEQAFEAARTFTRSPAKKLPGCLRKRPKRHRTASMNYLRRARTLTRRRRTQSGWAKILRASKRSRAARATRRPSFSGSWRLTCELH